MYRSTLELFKETDNTFFDYTDTTIFMDAITQEL